NSEVKGLYFRPNPLRTDVRPKAPGEKTRAAKDEDVLERRWLLIDIDPVRAEGSATDAEKLCAWAVADRVLGILEGVGLRGFIIGDAGNGYHVCIPILLPNDQRSRDLVQAILKGLHARCSDDQAKVDTACYNASRMWKLYGTLTRKGEH